jgi:hypothetical protein
MSIQAYTAYPYSAGFKSGEFHHIALSISGTTHTLYLDGSAVITNVVANIFDTFTQISNTVIGANSSLAQAFRGIIGDVRIYNYTITANKVSSLYFNRNLVVHYPFDTVVNSFTPNYGTMQYDASFIGQASLTTGFIGTNALSLTNSTTENASQYIKSSPKWKLNSSTGLTISCWVNTTVTASNGTMRIFDIPLSDGIKGLSVDISGSDKIYSSYYT